MRGDEPAHRLSEDGQRDDLPEALAVHADVQLSLPQGKLAAESGVAKLIALAVHD